MSNIFDEVQLVPGSSSLLAKNVLPIGKLDKVAKLSELFTLEQIIQTGVSEDEATQFYEKFKDSRIKKGALDHLPTTINKLLGRVISREPAAPRTSAPRTPREPKVVAEADPIEVAPVVYPSLQSTPVVDPKVFTMMGISGTGKGTRLSQLIHFLTSKMESTNIIAMADKPCMIGVYFKDLNLICLGKWVRSNKSGRMISFSSFDWIQSLVLASGKNIFDLINSSIKDLNIANVAFEGYPCMIDYRTITGKVNDGIGIIPAVHTQYFQYPLENGFELLQDRIVGRSGSRIKGTCWAGNIGIGRTGNAHNIAIQNNELTGYSETFDYNAPVTTFGEHVLSVLKPSLVSEFLEFSKENNTLRHLDDVDGSIQKVSTYYDVQIANVMSGVNVTI